MLSAQAQAIRSARLAVGLTQEQLGHRVGVKGRAILRIPEALERPFRRHLNADSGRT